MCKLPPYLDSDNLDIVYGDIAKKVGNVVFLCDDNLDTVEPTCTFHGTGENGVSSYLMFIGFLLLFVPYVTIIVTMCVCVEHPS